MRQILDAKNSHFAELDLSTMYRDSCSESVVANLILSGGKGSNIGLDNNFRYKRVTAMPYLR